MINSIMGVFEMNGSVLVPGEYAIRRHTLFGEHILEIYNNGNKAGTINVFHSLKDQNLSADFKNHNIEAFAVYDDAQKRFKEPNWRDPNDLLHIAMTYDKTPCRLSGSEISFGPTQKGLRTVLVFNKTLDKIVQDPSQFERTVDLAANNRAEVKYYLDQFRYGNESH
jgi:hypothetical protein